MTLFAVKKHFAFCTCKLSIPPLGEIVFPFRLERLNNSLICPLLFVSTQIFLLFGCQGTELSDAEFMEFGSAVAAPSLRALRLWLGVGSREPYHLSVWKGDLDPRVLSEKRIRIILRTSRFAGRSGWTRTIDLALIRRAL